MKTSYRPSSSSRLKFGSAIRRRRRRQRLATLVVLLVLVSGTVYALGSASGGGGSLFGPATEEPPGAIRSEEEVRQREAPDLSGETPAAAAYEAVAAELPGAGPESVRGVYRSVVDPSWASVRVAEPGGEADFVVFLEEEGGVWKARRSARADEPDYPQNDQAVLGEVPEDLVGAMYPEILVPDPEPREEPVKPEELPEVSPPEVPPSEPVMDEVPKPEREGVEDGLEEAGKAVEGYQKEDGGIAGFYARDLEGDWGYGARPDEVFFSASVIKLPVMVAVYRKMEAGELSGSDFVEITETDWAAGAGWLQWQLPGASYTVDDYVWMMMVESDNVATNVLIRLVGGPEYVNEVARSMGAENTVLYQKVTSERAAVPSLDNRTTPRDMATMLEKISDGEAASPESCRQMVEIMRENAMESWLEQGISEEVVVDNKGGWLYKVYNDVGIVEHKGHPYAVAILAQHGPSDPDLAEPHIEDISRAVWEIQDRR